MRKPDSVKAQALAKAKWESSGLEDKHAKRLGLRGLTAEETAALGSNFAEVASLHIPYFDLNGRKTKFFRVRYLEPLPGFDGQVDKPQKYAQKAGTLNEVYLPPAINWSAAATDVSVTIYFAEGELKSGAGCAHGFCTIGLGGVDVWRSAKRGLEIFPMLEKFRWEGRQVCVVYDSDAASKPGVLRAQRAIAKELLSRGAEVSIASLPDSKDLGDDGKPKKQGLDDFLVANGPEALGELLDASPAFPESDALWGLNEQVIYIRNPGVVVEKASGFIMDPHRFKSHIYANRHFSETVVKGKSVSLVKAPLAQRWIEWERRDELLSMTYSPGKPKTIDKAWNLWPGWGCAPKKGDVAPWKWLLDFTFKSDLKARQWFERWCAYPIQHPGAKLYSACLLWSHATGIGKTLIAYTLMKIYGQNSIEIKSKTLKGGFNSWAKNRQFIYGDEITGGEARVDADWLKGLITQHTVNINEKFLPEYSTPDCMNYLFTSNHPDALFVEDRDRRYFVHEIVGKPAEREEYQRYDAWLKADGPSHLFQHLLDLKLGDFNPKEHAPETVSKQQMVRLGKGDAAVWLSDLRVDPPTMLKPLGEKVAAECDIFTQAILHKAFDPDGSKHRISASLFGRALIAAGYRQLNGGTPIRTDDGIHRLYAVRNAEKWEQATRKECADHFAKYFGINAGKY